MAKIYFDNHSLDLARAKIFNSLVSEEQVSLFDAIELSSGDYLPKSKMEYGKFKVYGGGGLTQSTHTTSNVDVETIGIGRVGARCGCVFKIEKKSWVTDNALYVSKFKKKYDLSFLIHYLNHINLNQFANQSAQPVISQRGIAKCTIPDIEFYKQQQIGDILDSIESGEDFEDIYNLKPVLEFERNLSLLNTELDQQQTYLQLLRQTILQEAVQGKLLSPSIGGGQGEAEPATELLKRIKAEKEKLIKAGKLKKEKELPPITEDEIPFELPEGWVWVRGDDVAAFIDPQPSHRTPSEVLNGVPYIGMTEVRDDGTIDFESARKVSEGVFREHNARYTLEDGDFIIGKIGTIGEPTFLPKPFNYTLSANIILVQPFRNIINPFFITYYLQSPIAIGLLKTQSTNSTHLVFGIKKSRMLLFPLPPLAEQQSIVAKVQQLQQQLSQLEAQVQQSRQYAQQLLQRVLKEAFEQKGKVYEMEEEVSMVAEGEAWHGQEVVL